MYLDKKEQGPQCWSLQLHTECMAPVTPLINTLCFQSCYPYAHAPWIAIHWGFRISLLCCPLSEVFWKSKYIMSNMFFCIHLCSNFFKKDLSDRVDLFWIHVAVTCCSYVNNPLIMISRPMAYFNFSVLTYFLFLNIATTFVILLYHNPAQM